MTKSTSGHAGHAIQRVLELSANAQITRRKTLKHSPAFHSLTGAIVAYSKTLSILTALQQREEFFRVVIQDDLSERFVVVAEERIPTKGGYFLSFGKRRHSRDCISGQGVHT